MFEIRLDSTTDYPVQDITIRLDKSSKWTLSDRLDGFAIDTVQISGPDGSQFPVKAVANTTFRPR